MTTEVLDGDFHREWGKAHDKPDYDKPAWVRMQMEIERLQRVETWAQQACAALNHSPSAPCCSGKWKPHGYIRLYIHHETCPIGQALAAASTEVKQ